MPKKTQLALVAVLATLLQSACVASASSPSCSFTGEKYLPSAMSADDVCAAFEKRFGKALSGKGKAASSQEFVLTVSLNARGSIEVQAVKQGADPAEKLPNVAVDVMDRAVESKDFERLADALAEVLTQ